jgi:alcohol dehydrogenase
MQSFQHITPPLRLFCGADSLVSLDRELERVGSRRAVVFCGPWAEGPLLNAVLGAIGDRCAKVFDGVVAHSPVDSVQHAASVLKSVEADAVIALGGGSSIVTARAASILLAENDEPRNLCTTRDESGKLRSPKLLAPKLPQFIVPTTPTTAMVKAGSAVFDPSTGERLALFDPKTRAHAIFVHPKLILSSPPALAINASLNTLSMAIEGLVSRSGDPLSDATLIHVLRILAEYLPRMLKDDNADARAELVLAAVMCGQGTDYTGAGITTVLGHAIGARHHLDNGVANAIVLPTVLRFNGTSAETGLRKVAAGFGISTDSEGEMLVEDVVGKIESLFSQLNVPRRLRDVGVEMGTLPEIASHAIGDWFLGGNPRSVSNESELQQILEKTW